jgi:hypothetical protein
MSRRSLAVGLLPNATADSWVKVEMMYDLVKQVKWDKEQHWRLDEVVHFRAVVDVNLRWQGAKELIVVIKSFPNLKTLSVYKKVD